MNVMHSAWKNGVKKLEFLGSSCIYPRIGRRHRKEKRPFACGAFSFVCADEKTGRVHCGDCKYGPADLIKDGVNGYLIQYDDDEMFIKRVSYLMNDKEQRLRRGAECKNNAVRYTPATIMSQWLKLYAGL